MANKMSEHGPRATPFKEYLLDIFNDEESEFLQDQNYHDVHAELKNDFYLYSNIEEKKHFISFNHNHPVLSANHFLVIKVTGNLFVFRYSKDGNSDILSQVCELDEPLNIKIKQTLRYLLDSFSESDQYSKKLSLKFGQILSFLLSQVFDIEMVIEDQNYRSKRNNFLRMMSAINSRKDTSFELKDIANDINLSEQIVEELAETFAHLSFSDLVLLLRLEKARALLRKTEDSILDIAKQCTFNNENDFIDAFNSIYLYAPYDYRQLYKRGGLSQQEKINLNQTKGFKELKAYEGNELIQSSPDPYERQYLLMICNISNEDICIYWRNSEGENIYDGDVIPHQRKLIACSKEQCYYILSRSGDFISSFQTLSEPGIFYHCG